MGKYYNATAPRPVVGKELQMVRTPDELLLAVQKKFKTKLMLDCASNPIFQKDSNGIIPYYICDPAFEPDDLHAAVKVDAAAYHWADLLESVRLHSVEAILNRTVGHTVSAWLNPEFGDTGMWIDLTIKNLHHAADQGIDFNIYVLTLCSVSSKWFRKAYTSEYCERVYALTPRVKFVGHKNSYPKDLVVWKFSTEPKVYSKFCIWDWKSE